MNTYTKFYPNRTMGKGWKIGGNKILVLDAKYADFKQSPNVILDTFWHAVFGLVFLLRRFLHIPSRGLFDGHTVAPRNLQNMATLWLLYIATRFSLAPKFIFRFWGVAPAFAVAGCYLKIKTKCKKMHIGAPSSPTPLKFQNLDLSSNLMKLNFFKYWVPSHSKIEKYSIY